MQQILSKLTKMNKLNFGIFAALITGMVLSSCKKEPNVAPSKDEEVQTSIDATYATFLVSDVEMICSWIAEDASTGAQKFYIADSLKNTGGDVIVIRSNITNRVSINFNNTYCMDGRVRDGSLFIFFKEEVFMQYPPTGNENYMRDYNFTGRITCEEYKVDGWLVDNSDFESDDPNQTNYPILLKNLRPNNSTPVAGNLKWSFQGAFKMKNGSDSMAWKGTLTKTLENTSNTKVFATNAQSAINWSLATISYTGQAKGYTPGNVPFSMKFYDGNLSLKRDFTCFPDKVSGVALTNSLSPQISEFHPFTSGVVSFTTGTAYPREIYFDNTQYSYGGEDNPVPLAAQCDNKATVQIKGIFYPIDLKK